MPNYQIRILSSFEQDLNQIVDYIALTLSNPSAAMNLVENVHKAVEERANYPLSFQPFLSQKKKTSILRHPSWKLLFESNLNRACLQSESIFEELLKNY